MSLARVTTQRAAKPYSCEKCKSDIARGDSYRAFKVGFRSRTRHIRCTRAKCTPHGSELESSKLAGVYAAQEDAHASIDAATTHAEITEALETCAEAIREVAGEYAEAAEAMGDAGSDMAEKAEILESSADDLENIDISEPDDDESDGSLDNARSEAHGAVDAVEMP